MDDTTPPKRVTRSKATAKTKTTEPDLKIATAAAKAKTTRTAVNTVTKRKTRTDDVEDSNSKDTINGMSVKDDVVVPKATRGRKKAMETELGDELVPNEALSVPSPPPVKSTRGRPKKSSEEAPPVELVKATRGRAKKAEALEGALTKETDTIELARPIRGRSRKVEEPLVEEVQQAVLTKSTRGRPKKIEVIEEPQVEEATSTTSARSTRGRPKRVMAAEQHAAEDVSEPLMSTRGRAATTSRAANVSKKFVKFEEPQEQDKENLIPEMIVKGKEAESSTGLTAKPVRKPAVSTRTVRGRTKMGKIEDKPPLTPKKATQIATGRENLSEDELATMEKTPMKILTKSPDKAPGSIFGTAKKLDFTTSLVANRAITQEFGASLMGSPARRPPPSPYKDSFKTSPKRPNLGDSMLRSPFKSSTQLPKAVTSPFKASLLQSPARRPQSPAKISDLGSLGRSRPLLGATPKFGVSRLGTTPRTVTKSFSPPRRSLLGSPSKKESEEMRSIDSNLNTTSVEPFPGRLSSILPRDVDPIMQGTAASMDAAPKSGIIQEEEETSMKLVDDNATIVDPQPREVDLIMEDIRSTTPPNSPPRYSIGNFTLQDEDPFQNSESEDELASGSPKYSPAPLNTFNIASKDFAIPATLTPALPVHKTPKTIAAHRSDVEHNYSIARGDAEKSQKDQEGFIQVSNQRSDWISAESSFPPSSAEENNRSPTKSGLDQQVNTNIQTGMQSSPAKSTFFEDAMTTENFVGGSTGDILGELPPESNDEIDALAFAPQTLDEEDFALAAEADEMSLITVNDAEDVAESIDLPDKSVHGDARAASEASQEYGDENAAPTKVNLIPIDPALIALDAQYQTSTSTLVSAPQISTPVRVLGESERWLHTVSKVPLKPAAMDSPLKVNKRSASASRMQAQRQAPLPPSFYTPKLPSFTQDLVLTPNQSNSWSTAGTPIRSPRRILNDQVLKGAVVFVDVHTTEGADASAVFIDLLGQMGARCPKTWSWNPNTTSSPETTGADQDLTGGGGKIGITHVVFKDGSKRTLEKVRESKGVVLCVGVGWVLDCERQQKWLSESPYTVDTGLIPRGGHRRRKSMEPRSIQNLNGTLSLLPGPGATPRSVSAGYSVSPTKEFLNLPDTPGTSSRSARRKSTLWVRSPSNGDAHDDTSTGLMLSPVPATPAPETISAYAEHVLDDATPDGGTTPYFLHREELVQRTCPPKTGFGGNDTMEGLQFGSVNGEAADISTGSGVLMQRLLLARRKSLQWAPKVGSPLARGGFGA